MAFAPPKQLLERFGLRPKHSFGQNFLSDPNLVGKIAALVGDGEHVRVLEIGAGLGALTHELLERGHSVVAIERDRDLVPVLSEVFAEELSEGRLEVVEADAKALDWAAALRGNGDTSGETANLPLPERTWVVAGNLPYQITGPLIEKTVHMGGQIRRAVFLVQKEVADRLAAQEGTKQYGVLSVFVQARFVVKSAFTIKPGAFVPQPGVDSRVVVFQPRDVPLSEETPEFRQVVKTAFAARRKTLRNAWKGLGSNDLLSAIAADVGIDLASRGETLTVEQFASVARLLSERKEAP